jgi:hypothetical protein
MDHQPPPPTSDTPVVPPAATSSYPAPPPPPAPLPGRPGAVTATAWILIVLGALVALVGAIVLISGAFFDAIAVMPEMRARFGRLPDAFGGFLAVVGALLLAYGIAQLVSGVNILARREWARIAGLVVAILGAMLTLGSLTPGRGTTFGGTIVVLLLFAAYAQAVYTLLTSGRWFAEP